MHRRRPHEGQGLNRWTPPSFDPPSEPSLTLSQGGGAPATVQQLQGIQAKAHQESFARGLQEGLEEGRAQGVALGRQEGYQAGHAEGLQAGFQKSYQQGAEQVQHLTQSLQGLIDQLTQLSQAIEPELTRLAYETALRLSGQKHLDLAPFTQAVKEALSQLPSSGEQVVLRVPVDEAATWQELSQQASAGIAFKLIPDVAVAPGQAFVEWCGTRADVGAQARQALVRSALGLLNPTPESSVQ
jgi:flagellar assembly protein FliH